MNLKRDKQGKTKAKHKLVYALPIDEINDRYKNYMSKKYINTNNNIDKSILPILCYIKKYEDKSKNDV